MHRAPSIIKNTKARTMIWAQHMARLREKERHTRALVKKPATADEEDLDVDGRIQT